MQFCLDCGKEIKDELVFCVHCGSPIESDDLETSVKLDASSETQESADDANGLVEQKSPTVHKKPLSKLTKIIISIVAIMALLLFGTHKWLESHYDPMKELAAMDQAISNDDMKTFLSHIEFDEDAILDRQAYFEYIRDYEWDAEVKEQYKDIIEDEKLAPNPVDKEISDGYDASLFKVKNKKKFGIYPGFSLQALPTQVEAYSNMEKAIITFHNKEVEMELKDEDDSVIIGNVYPGTYEVEAKSTGEYGEFTYTDMFDIDAQDMAESIYIDFDYRMVEINPSYDFEDAFLYIDGKKTEQKLDDYYTLGPLPEEAEMKLHAEWKDANDNVVRSNSVQLNDMDDYSSIYFDFDETKLIDAAVAEAAEDNDTEAGQFVLSFRDAYEEAVNYADYDEVADFLKKDSHAQKEISKFIGDMEEGTYYYDFEENTILEIKNNDGKTFEVKTNEKFTFIDKDYKEYNYDREKMYQVELIDGDFKISKIDYTDTKKNKVN